ncbi:DUF3570 domain-containing protein [Massilia sp. TS11]|uniref:DUF3570 domain-containing protein n=1 Tax=Massilia sp. TS11 TaxID=2908003 RepID=UPI001EDC0209|nr:DUF3570 domain-containing protein [Massilia sp. TS11]MCG2583761.1 DUF3570 domain-containing protein [Massilia sp. TS11]
MSTATRLMAAALALSAPVLAQAEAAPESASIGIKYLNYQDRQPGVDRIKVTAPAVDLLLPFAGNWSFNASHVVDTISGASPAYHTEALSKLEDKRHGTDIGLARYSDNATLNLGLSYSQEHDYVSRGLSAGIALESEDKNTTWTYGVNYLRDTIDPSNHVVIGERKRTVDLAAGVTQVLTQADIAQVVLGYSRGRGYYSDPYKVFDERPQERDHFTVLLRWNHHISSLGATSRLAYRFYRDTFGIQAHTVTAEWVQPFGEGWTLTPSVRLYTQTAADFYVEHDTRMDPFPTNPPPGARYYTEEQRLSAYGGRTFGFKLAKQVGAWTLDLKLEDYRQRAAWTWFGSGSRNLAPFSARMLQAGASYQF